MHELVIVGAGPAGMTAAVYAARKKIKTLLLSKDLGGQVLWSGGVENYMGYQYIEGVELMQKFEEQVRQFPIDQEIGQEASGLLSTDEGFEVRAEASYNYQTKTVIVATGKRPRKLEVPGEDRLKGRGVSYCATCDGPLFSGEKVAVAGGGNSALEAADDMSKIAEHVYVVSTTHLTGDGVLIERAKKAPNVTMLLEHRVAEVKGESRVEGITLGDLKSDESSEIDVGAVFVEMGLIPNSDIVRGIASLNESDEIIVNTRCETGVPGLFAAGDVANVPDKQIVIAAAEGAKAALQAHRYLQRH